MSQSTVYRTLSLVQIITQLSIQVFKIHSSSYFLTQLIDQFDTAIVPNVEIDICYTINKTKRSIQVAYHNFNLSNIVSSFFIYWDAFKKIILSHTTRPVWELVGGLIRLRIIKTFTTNRFLKPVSFIYVRSLQLEKGTNKSIIHERAAIFKQ